MTVYGLTPTGYVAKTTALVRQDINALLIAKFGASFDVSDGSPDGALAGIVAERIGQMWDLSQQVAASQDPDQATGAALDALCLLTGTFRTPAKSSTATLTLTGTPGTIVASQSQAKTTSTGQPFATTAAATITALTAWAITTAYVVGDRRTNGGNCYQCITAGTSAGSGGPTTTAADITDGSVHWRYLGGGTGAIDVLAASVNTGAIVGVSGDINLISTPVGGWTSVINVLDAALGNDVQTDASLRVARIAQLSAPGIGTPNAIRAAVLGVSGVTTCTVFPNNTDVVDANGQSPHSVQALVQGGADQDIENVLFGQVVAGIAFFGTTTGSVVDSQGNSQTVKFSRPAQILIYADVTLTYDTTKYAGDAAVKAAIATYGAAQLPGKDAVASGVVGATFGAAGVLDASQVLIYTDVIGTPVAWAPTTAYVATVGARSVVTNGGRAYICTVGGTSAGSGGPTGTGTAIVDGGVTWSFLGATIAISPLQLAMFDTSRVNVHSSAATP